MSDTSNSIYIDLDKINTVVKNQEPVSSVLLEIYNGKPDQLNLLVKIIAEAQGVDPNSAGFVEFIKKGELNWDAWALVAKDFRNWLNTSHYTYENTGAQGLAELYLEWLNKGDSK